MRELRSEVVGERRVRLLVDSDGRYTVTIEVWAGAWEDISLRSDQGLALLTASLCYRLRLTEQEARTVEWGGE
jgi:hypothetical protein